MALLKRIVKLRVASAGLVLGISWLGATEPATAQAPPRRMANPYYASGPAAANAAASLAEPIVVYPATTTNAMNAKGLPRDRVAALRAAVRVTALDEAYRAGVAATDIAATDPAATNRYAELSRTSVLSTSQASEPPRFAPAVNATQLQQSIGGATASTMRRDAEVQPVAWLSDAPNSTTPQQAKMSATNQVRDPQFQDPQVHEPHVRASRVGNPLRRDVENGSGNPLR